MEETQEVETLREDFVQKLLFDRLIKIYIGTGENEKSPFLVPQSTLSAASEYFVKAIKNEGLGQASESSVLRFPDDDLQAWKTMLYWMAKGKMLPNLHLGSDVLLVHCWILGDKYLMPNFQDLIMLELLRMYDESWATSEALAVGFHSTSQDSLLRRLLAEEALAPTEEDIDVDESRVKTLQCLDGATGVAVSLVDAMIRLNQFRRDRRDVKSHSYKGMPMRIHDGSFVWEKFLLAGEYPEYHWIHGDALVSYG